MLEKPALDDARLIAQLSTAYGLGVRALTFLPLGADAGTAVYRAEASDGRDYFLKLRRGPCDEITVAVPRFLSEQGIRQVIAPLPTTGDELWSNLDDFTLTLFPFVEGEDGYAVHLTQQQWVEGGAVLKRMHSAPLPAALKLALPRESYSPQWRKQVRAFQARLRATPFENPVSAELAAFMQAMAIEVDQLVDAAERLARVLQRRGQSWVLCHADIHAGNFLLTPSGALYVVDWDTAMLAPIERDLMFFGAGWYPPGTEAWFYQGYGPAEADPAALAYYRCERMVEDTAAYCHEILSTAADSADRAQGLRYLTSSFQKGGIVHQALDAYRAVE